MCTPSGFLYCNLQEERQEMGSSETGHWFTCYQARSFPATQHAHCQNSSFAEEMDVIHMVTTPASERPMSQAHLTEDRVKGQ